MNFFDNQMKNHKKYWGLVALVILSAGLTGCSKGPSESDAKKAVEASLGNCEYLSIGSFDKVNGTPIGDNHYVVDLKYSIKMKPTPDIESYASEKYAQEVGNLRKQVAHAHEVENAYKADQNSWIEANPGSGISAYEVAHQQRFNEYQSVVGLLLQGDQMVSNAPRTAKAAMEQAMRKSCPSVPPALLDNMFSGDEPVEKYASSVEQTFTGKMSMVKTDNGWQEDR